MRDNEDDLLRSVALQNANSILLARQRGERELIKANEALAAKTEELAQSLSMMRATLESTTDGIIVEDEEGNLADFNEHFIEIWSIPREIIDAKESPKLREVISAQLKAPHQFFQRIEAIHLSSPAESFDVLELADGRTIERFSRTRSVNGRSVGRVWTFRDITERRRAEERLREVAIDNARLFEAAKNAAEERKHLLESERAARSEAERASAMKDEFLATLSHELRTPLSAILGWSKILQHGVRNEADLRKGLDIIERNARVQTQLIEDLLDMSRITSGKVRLDIQPLDPVSFIEAAIETVRPAAEAKGIRIEKVLDTGAGPISGDPGRLQQVVWNLLSNAIKFTPKDGKVQILLQRVNSHIEIDVADTGIGINPEFLPHVFERFRQADHSSTRAYGGLGLGLSIVKSLVELHGGTVRADSPGQGRGTTFTVQLPLKVIHRNADGEERHPTTPSTPPLHFEHADLSEVKVLVVDDEADARDLIRRVLEECSAEVITARTAAEAVALIEKERPHVIVSDIGMPDVDGYEFLGGFARLVT